MPCNGFNIANESEEEYADRLQKVAKLIKDKIAEHPVQVIHLQECDKEGKLRELLEQVRDDYPQSSAAGLANDFLRQSAG